MLLRSARIAIVLAVTLGSAAVTVLAGCGGSQSPNSLVGSLPHVAPQHVGTAEHGDPTGGAEGYKLIYTFPGGAGGADPEAPPTFVGGVAFGTTYSGGDVSGCNCGTVFANGKVIYDFKGASSGDGAYPTGALLLVGNELYGETLQGGQTNGVCTSGNIDGCGTILAIDTKGSERVIYRFKGGSDGEAPVGSLVSENGVLYGVTAKGGTNETCSDGLPGCGVVFSVDLSGHEKVIYRFKGGTDGALPSVGLLLVKGQLYGTTATGGGVCPSSASGCGTVFRVTPSGSEKILHAFTGGKDGQYPNSALILANDSLYGTTGFGGCKQACGPSSGYGTIFKMSLSGSETIIQRFIKELNGGENPEGPVVFLNGQLFGTTPAAPPNYGGTIYSATPKHLTYLYRFPITPGNIQGPTGLMLKHSTQLFYGTARVGGGSGNGGGIYSYSL
jgi:uncharacterized repeat protein (TIGR03803 family)